MSKFLFQIIQSMELREKAYFKRFTNIYSNKENKNYMMIYSYLEKMPEYNKAKIQNHFSHSTIGKYLSSEMNYLEEQILKMMVNFHFNDSPKNKLQKNILYINILIDKGFTVKANKLLKKTKTIAYKFEEFNIILGLIQQEEELLFHEGILGFTEKLIELQNERNQIINIIDNLNSLRILREQIRDFQVTIGFVAQKNDYPHIYSNPLLKSIDKAISIKAKEHWYYIKDYSFYLTHDNKKSLQISREYLNFVENNLHIFKNTKLLPLISNYLHNCSLVQDEREFELILNKLLSLKNDTKLDSVYIDYIRFSRIMEMNYNSNKHKSNIVILDQVTHFASENLDQLTNLQAEYFLRLIIRSYILINNFEAALKWSSLFYSSRIIDITIDQFRIYWFIINFELNRFEKLSHELESAVKVLKSRKRFTKLAQAFIYFFRQCLKKPGEIHQLLNSLEKKLNRIAADNHENFAFEHFDYRMWVIDYRNRHR